MEVKFRVRQDLAYWACDAGSFAPGEEHVISGDENTAKAVVAAAAAGALVDLKLDAEASAATVELVESDADSESKLNAAMADGSWLEGHMQQFELDKEAGVIEVGGQ